MKNNADALIFHTAICAADATNSYERRRESDIPVAVPSTQSVCVMGINLNGEFTKNEIFDICWNRVDHHCLRCNPDDKMQYCRKLPRNSS